VNLIGRVKYELTIPPLPDPSDGIYPCRSHPDVAEIHYPELFKQIFPTGYTDGGSAY